MKKFFIFCSLLLCAVTFAGNEPVNRFVQQFKKADAAFEIAYPNHRNAFAVPDCCAISSTLAASLAGQPIPGSPWGALYNPIQDCNGVWVISFMEVDAGGFIEGVDWVAHEFCYPPDPCEIDPENCE